MTHALFKGKQKEIVQNVGPRKGGAGIECPRTMPCLSRYRVRLADTRQYAMLQRDGGRIPCLSCWVLCITGLKQTFHLIWFMCNPCSLYHTPQGEISMERVIDVPAQPTCGKKHRMIVGRHCMNPGNLPMNPSEPYIWLSRIW